MGGYAFSAALICLYVASRQGALAAALPSLFFLGGFVYLWRRLHRESGVARAKWEAGRGGEAKALEIVRGLREARYICVNFEFQSGKKSRCETDLLVITEAGIFNIEVKYLAKTVRGEVKAAHWRQGKATQLRNPLLQVRRSSHILRQVVRQAGLGAVDVYSLVYFSHPHARVEIDGPHPGVFVCFSADALQAYIREQKAVYASGDLKGLVECLRKAQ